MISIRPIGTFLPLDEAGFISNPCLEAPFGKPWDQAMEVIVAFLKNEYPDQLRSIWLRGSVAQGKGVPGQSDLDVFALTKKPGMYWAEIEKLSSLQADLKPFLGSDFPLECQLESFTGQPKELRSQIAMLIATQSVCLWGEDIRETLGKYKPSKAVMLEYRWVAQDVEEWIVKIVKGTSWTEADFRSFMKTIIRAGFELVMERDGRYTRDLYPAYQVFSDYYPKREPDMRQALFWYLNPPPDEKELYAFLQDFGRWLGEQFRV